MRNNKKNNKNIRNAVAATVALALLVCGTFAWQSFNQEMLNETYIGGGDSGARLHDDFDGLDKDIYIENYATVEEGSSVIARVRLDEYMEIGDNAGDFENELRVITVLRGDLKKEEVETVIFENKETWDTYSLYKEDGFTPIDSENSIRQYRDLSFGGTKAYMPTFNKNNQILTSDINGTIGGMDGNRNTQRYDDYATYTTVVSEHDESSKHYNYIVGDEEYYLPPGGQVPEHLNEYDQAYVTQNNGDNSYTVFNVTHTAKETLTSDYAGSDNEILSMAQWEALGEEEKIGNFWVYDTDGWAYWASPLEPQEATSLLLTAIDIIAETSGTSYYYAVNVISQFVTAGDMGDETATNPEDMGMYESITENGKSLIALIENDIINKDKE